MVLLLNLYKTRSIALFGSIDKLIFNRKNDQIVKRCILESVAQKTNTNSPLPKAESSGSNGTVKIEETDKVEVESLPD